MTDVVRVVFGLVVVGVMGGCADDEGDSCPAPSPGEVFIDGSQPHDSPRFIDPSVPGFTRLGDLQLPNSETPLTICCIPDADSFDSFEESSAAGGPIVQVPYGQGTPVAHGGSCKADGKQTGPRDYEASGDLADLYPSKWCRKPGCSD